MVRKSLVTALGLAAGVGLMVPPPASAIDPVDSRSLRKAVTVNGLLQHEREFQRIANANEGTRASGTSGYDASVRYVMKRLRAAGYDTRRQAFAFDFFRQLAPSEVSTITPTPADLESETFTYSGNGDVTGTVVPIDVTVPPSPAPGSTSGCEASDFPAAPAGLAIALVQRGTCTFGIKADNAAAAGYDAVLIFNEGQPGRTEVLSGTLGAPSALPVVGLSYDDGAELYAQSQQGAVTARVATSTESEERTTYNVIATSPRGQKDENVVVGAHLDSVIEGPGINDNGSGAAIVLEIAEEMARLKQTKKLQRQLTFAFWGAEELGLLGAEHYVSTLRPRQLERTYANLNFDMMGSPNYARFVYDGDGSDSAPAGPPGSGAIEKIFTDYFATQGLASAPTEFSGRSDYGPFIDRGIPAGGLFTGAEGIKTEAEAVLFGGTAGVAYDACYHQACDNLNNLSVDALNEMGDAAAHAVLVMGKSKTGFYPDGSRTKASGERKAPGSTRHTSSDR